MVLVRHGHAGTKEGWTGDDALRPLSPRGMRQAKHLIGVLLPLKPRLLVSSPLLRCLQTLEPTAAETGMDIVQDRALRPDAGGGALEAVEALSVPGNANPVVLCTHGEVMGEVLTFFADRDGVRLGRRPPGLKGSVWVLYFRKGKATTARYIAPPR
jgi:8-oxo-(d)GTP phosphatase